MEAETAAATSFLARGTDGSASSARTRSARPSRTGKGNETELHESFCASSHSMAARFRFIPSARILPKCSRFPSRSSSEVYFPAVTLPPGPVKNACRAPSERSVTMRIASPGASALQSFLPLETWGWVA